MYRVTIDKGACEGIFACLTRDPRFVEDDDGLATVDPDADPVYGSSGWVRTDDGTVVAEFDDDRLAEARQAAEACPPGAITVEEVGEPGERQETGDSGTVEKTGTGEVNR